MFDHVSIQVRDVALSAAFYDAVLAPLGSSRLMEIDVVIGYGADRPQFWLGPITTGGETRELHIAFSTEDRAAVVAFHHAAVTAGAEILHPPRLWPEYHPTYFGTFARDPDGNNVEAVCHAAD
jgi:catechol 2,3-dioxygenase-like lactoylglutathione lyase family enzyme